MKDKTRFDTPNPKKPPTKTVRGENKSETLPQNSRNAANVMPNDVEYSQQGTKHDFGMTYDDPCLGLGSNTEIRCCRGKQDEEDGEAENCLSGPILCLEESTSLSMNRPIDKMLNSNSFRDLGRPKLYPLYEGSATDTGVTTESSMRVR
jgi:hypothetical protein